MNTYRLESGVVVYGVHDARLCVGRHCTIHNPSDHEYRIYPQVFEMGVMERKLPDGTYILDPDEAAYQETKLIRNSAKCLVCESHIQSRHRWDLVDCSCGRIFVDGGYNYPRRGGEPGDLEETSIYLN